MLEANIENRFVNGIKKRGAKVWKFVCPGTNGVQDRIVLMPGGRAIFVELKKPGEVRKPLQIKRALELHELGFEVHCLDSYRAIDRFFVEVFGK